MPTVGTGGNGRESFEWARWMQSGYGVPFADAVLDAPITSVREVDVGVSCEVHVVLTINARTAKVRSAWHYASAEAAPRLVTAFPTP